MHAGSRWCLHRSLNPHLTIVPEDNDDQIKLIQTWNQASNLAWPLSKISNCVRSTLRKDWNLQAQLSPWDIHFWTQWRIRVSCSWPCHKYRLNFSWERQTRKSGDCVWTSRLNLLWPKLETLVMQLYRHINYDMVRQQDWERMKSDIRFRLWISFEYLEHHNWGVATITWVRNPWKMVLRFKNTPIKTNYKNKKNDNVLH